MKHSLQALGALLCAFALSGCAGTGNALLGNNNPRVRMVNAINGPNVTATISDDGPAGVAFTNAPFGTVSTQLIVTNGDRTVTFMDAGTNAVIATRTSLFELNHDYTVVAFGPAGANNVVITGGTSTPAPNKAGVRFVQAGGSANPVDIYLGAPGSTILQATKQRNDLQSGGATVYNDVNAGTRKVFVTGANDIIVQASAEFDFQAGKHYTVVIGKQVTMELINVVED